MTQLRPHADPHFPIPPAHRQRHPEPTCPLSPSRRGTGLATPLSPAPDPAGFLAGSYVVDLRGAQGIRVGDHNERRNIFGSPIYGP